MPPSAWQARLLRPFPPTQTIIEVNSLISELMPGMTYTRCWRQFLTVNTAVPNIQYSWFWKISLLPDRAYQLLTQLLYQVACP